MATINAWSNLAALTAQTPTKLDAYLTAALTNDFADYDIGDPKAPMIPVGFTIEANGTSQLQAAVGVVTTLFSNASDDSCLTTAHLQYSSTDRVAYATASVSPVILLALVNSRSVSEIQLCANLLPKRAVPRLTTITTSGESATGGPPQSEKKNLLVLIDHGCPFAHRTVLDGAGNTRVLTIWDQDAVPDFPTASGSVPTGFGYGRQVFASALNGFIKGATAAGQINEDLCYQLAEYPAMRSRATHGAFVMGLLAGGYISPSLNQSHRSERCEKIDEHEVIFVQLPRNVVMAPDRGNIERYTLDGIRYALACAPDDAELTAVIDYGTELGPHNGYGWFERALDAMIDFAATRQITLTICFPAGNSHEMKRHAVIYPATENSGLPAELSWWIPMGNDSPSTLEIWMREEQNNFFLELYAPGKTKPAFQIPGNANATLGNPISSWVAVSRGIAGQRQILIRLGPTNQVDGSKNTAESGVWRIRVKATPGEPAGPLNVYAAWGGGNDGLPQRQWPSKFILDGQFKDIVWLHGAGTILGSACSDKKHAIGSILVAGGYDDWSTLRRAKYSSAGPARNGRMNDWLAPTEESATLPGLLCIGTRSASLVRAQGTSFAAPQVARKIALGSPRVPRPKVSAIGTSGKPREEYGEGRL